MKREIPTDLQRLRFQITLRVLINEFQQRMLDIIPWHPELDGPLKGVRLISGEDHLQEGYAYVISPPQLAALTDLPKGCALVIHGTVKTASLPHQCPALVVKQPMGFGALFTLVQEIFEGYNNWDWELRQALTGENPLDELLLASIKVFHNPMFIHDNHFYILSDPAHQEDMCTWEKDRRSGKEIVPISLINDFRTDPEYLEGLKSRRTIMYSASQTGYRILYRNLWREGHFAGRILVDELNSAFKPSDFEMLDYLGTLLESYIASQKLVFLSSGNDLEQFFLTAMSTPVPDEQLAISNLQILDWKLTDHYMILKIVSDHERFSMISAYAVIGQIEVQLPFCKAFCQEDSIYVIVNRTRAGISSADIVQRLAILMRESLFKIGISSEIPSFEHFSHACRQADLALRFGRNSGSMHWYYYFDDYKLDYIVQCAGEQMPLGMLCCDHLDKLRRYDAQNNTELFHTLKVYLSLEKNVLQTSEKLFIHRSTLSYRLKKIQKIIRVDLDQPRERLKLLMSYYIDEGLQ